MADFEKLQKESEGYCLSKKGCEDCEINEVNVSCKLVIGITE